MDVGCSQSGFSASTMTWHHNIIQARPYPIFPEIHPHLNMYYGYNDAPICPSTASQGDKTLCIHPIWMWDAVAVISVFSLNHDTTTTYWLGHTPFPLKLIPTCTCNTAIMMHPYAHPQHLKVLNLNHFVYIQYGCGMQSMGVCSLNHDTTTS